jgi:hypothetical protein
LVAGTMAEYLCKKFKKLIKYMGPYCISVVGPDPYQVVRYGTLKKLWQFGVQFSASK